MGDGRWQLVEGEVGSWGMFHPRYPLEAILQARERVVVIGERRFRVELDRDKLSALSDAGVSPDWRPLAEVALSDGIVHSVQLDPVRLSRRHEWSWCSSTSQSISARRSTYPPRPTRSLPPTGSASRRHTSGHRVAEARPTRPDMHSSRNATIALPALTAALRVVRRACEPLATISLG
jgi:hypothetical protein